eukprot:1514943-Prymnesium_polylepis.2
MISGAPASRMRHAAQPCCHKKPMTPRIHDSLFNRTRRAACPDPPRRCALPRPAAPRSKAIT